MLIAFSLTAVSSAAVEVEGPFDVIDGDTISMRVGESLTVVNLWGVDAPELEQVWGDEAKQHLEKLVRDRVLEIEIDSLPEGQITARVFVGGEDLSELMLDSGWAWLSDGDETSEDYARALIVARSGRRGQWRDEYTSLTHPAIWREQHQANPTPPPATPTPVVNPLSRYAEEARLASSGDDSVSIDRIPTKEVRRREERELETALRRLFHRLSSVEYQRSLEERHCPSDDAGSGAGSEGATYWSEEEQRWVTEAPVTVSRECGRARQSIAELLEEIESGKAAAVNRALWYGLSESYVNQQVRRFGLEDF
jgi:endonuclease YncB( thermonuclease family)